MQTKIIRWPELKEVVPVSSVQVWRWEKDGKFPKRIKLGGNSVGWIESEINEWIEKRAADR